MKKYTIALSFAGTERELAENIANELKKREIKVFYDKFEQHELWGKDLHETLRNIYVRECRYVILFISEQYLNRMWTIFERKQIIDRLVHEHGEGCILPVRVDNFIGEVPGLSNSIAYVSIESNQHNIVIELILRKLGKKDYQIDSTEAFYRAVAMLDERKSGFIAFKSIITSLEILKEKFPKIISGQLLNWMGHEFYWKRANDEPLILFAKNDAASNAKGKGIVEICKFEAPEVWKGTGRYQICWVDSKEDEDDNNIVIILYLYSINEADLTELMENENASAAFLAALHLDSENTEFFNQLAEANYESLR